MKIWDCKKSKYVEKPKEMIEFLNEIENICKKYNLSISHEDEHGSFEIVRYDQFHIDWLQSANKDY